ncbi:hypothetical protein Aperf_G00000005104 [Anoplocephala perfoliata]
MKWQDVASKSDLQTVIDEHFVGARESVDLDSPPKPVKKPSIFKVFITGPGHDSTTQSEERKESKGKSEIHLLSPVKETKFDADPQEKQNKVQENKDDEGKKENGVGNDEEKKSLNQHSVSFEEGSEGSKRQTSKDGGDEDDRSSSENSERANQRLNEYTFSPSALQTALASGGEHPSTEGSQKKTSSRRLHSAKRLNELIVERSADAAAVLINLPALPKSPGSEFYYMEYVETLTDGLKRVILIRGTGREVITAFAE